MLALSLQHFFVIHQQLAETLSSTKSVPTNLLGAVATVSLLVDDIGVVIATGTTYGLSLYMLVPCAFDVYINVLVLVFSAGIGVLFGNFPARRAARMDPIEALRHE